MDYANVYTFSIHPKSIALISKRIIKHKESEAQDEGEKKQRKRYYEEMLDKETILGDACKAVKTRYRAANRLLTV